MKDIIKQTQAERDIQTRKEVFGKFNSGDDISISLIQRKGKGGYFSASRVLMNLIEDGFVEGGKTATAISKML